MIGLPAATDQPLGEGDGATTSFKLAKQYAEGERRRITRPVSGSVKVAIDGIERMSGWSLEARGTITLDDPPAEGAIVAAGFLFDVPVRFADDRLEINQATFLAGEAPSVPLIEVREE
jgi:uncharacterized protein (TIGR02217 family)